MTYTVTNTKSKPSQSKVEFLAFKKISIQLKIRIIASYVYANFV